MATSLAIFTRDLRLHDNPALAAATASSSHVVPVFVVDDNLIARCRAHASRLAFLVESLADLREGLRRLGGALVVRRGPWVPAVMDLARQTSAIGIHVADDYSSYAKRRLAALHSAAAAGRIDVVRHPGVTQAEPGALVPAGGGGAAGGAGSGAYQVFGPYYQRWQQTPMRSLTATPRRISLPAGLDPGQLPALQDLASERPAQTRPVGGERAGLARLHAWADSGLADYASSRDLLAADGISRLSPYLHLGCLSARSVAAELAGRRGSEDFLRQLAWRDFFHQVLAARPDSSWRDYKSRGDDWRDDADALNAWRAGRTGFPVVDAGMRQLVTEGFMHNRARMIVASFLTKDLYLDWRQGADYFMRQLADGDVACNQLNWQWVAGTGTDSSPHRIFNPVRQGERFDRGGDYVRRYVPELAAVPASQIHDPDAATRRACGYPQPVVDHRAAIAEYRARTAQRAAT